MKGIVVLLALNIPFYHNEKKRGREQERFCNDVWFLYYWGSALVYDIIGDE